MLKASIYLTYANEKACFGGLEKELGWPGHCKQSGAAIGQCGAEDKKKRIEQRIEFQALNYLL